jgi:uncharacterized protein (TIGR02246 family)
MKRVVPLAAMGLFAGGCQQMQPPAVDPRIDALVERQAIDQLVAGDYIHALDRRDWTTYASYYTEDGELSLDGQTAKGRSGIIAFLNMLPGDNRVIHVVTNLSYVIDRDSAVGGAYWQDIGMGGNTPAVLAAGHYEDTLRKVDGAWKFAKRDIVIDYAPTPAPAPADASK